MLAGLVALVSIVAGSAPAQTRFIPVEGADLPAVAALAR